MPETIRTASERLRSRPWRGGFLAAFVTANLFMLPASPADADVRLGATAVDAIHRSIATLRGQEITLLTFFLALLALSMFASVALVRARRTAERVETDARDEIVALQAETDRLKTLLLSEPAGPGDLGRGCRRAGNSRRHRSDYARRRPRTRACVRHLARARHRAPHGAGGATPCAARAAASS